MAKQSNPLQFKDMKSLEASGIKLSDSDRKSFEQFFAEDMKELTQTAFPALSKFMDSAKREDEDKASDQISRTEATRNGPSLLLNGTMIDTLDQIDDRLKVQSVILQSSLEQQTLQTQLINQLVNNGGAIGGGNGNGASGGGSLLDDVLTTIGAGSVTNWVKSLGTRLLGGGAALAGEAGEAILRYALPLVGTAAVAGGYIAAGKGASDLIKMKEEQDSNPLIKEREKHKSAAGLIDQDIEPLQTDLDRIKTRLEKNIDNEKQKEAMQREELKLQARINELQKKKANELAKAADVQKQLDDELQEQKVEDLQHQARLQQGLQDQNNQVSDKPKPAEQPVETPVKPAEQPASPIMPSGTMQGPSQGSAEAPGIPLGNDPFAAVKAAQGGKIGHTVGGEGNEGKTAPNVPHVAHRAIAAGRHHAASGKDNDSGTVEGKPAKGSFTATIFGGESGGSYNIVNRGSNGLSGVGHEDLENITIAQVQELQRHHKVFAAGAFQIIPKTLESAVKDMHLDPNTTKFDRETQNKIFSQYLAGDKRPQIRDYIEGKSDNLDAAQLASAQEWASVEYHGRGIYNHGDQASISDAKIQAALKNARKMYSETHNYEASLFGLEQMTKNKSNITGKQSSDNVVTPKPLPDDVSRLVDKNYEHLKDAPAIRDIGIQAHADDILMRHARENAKALHDRLDSTSSLLVRQSHEAAIDEVKKAATPPIVQLYNQNHSVIGHGDGSKSDRKDKTVGNANPPPDRLKLLFGQDKDWRN